MVMNTKLSTTNHIEAMWQHGATNHGMTPDYLAEFRWSQRLEQSRGHVALRYRNDNHHAVAWFLGTVTTTIRLTVAPSYYFDIFTKLKGGGGGGSENAVAPKKVAFLDSLVFVHDNLNETCHEALDLDVCMHLHMCVCACVRACVPACFCRSVGMCVSTRWCKTVNYHCVWYQAVPLSNTTTCATILSIVFFMLILVIFRIPYIMIWKFDLGIIQDSNSSSLTSKYMLPTLFLDMFIIADNLLITLSSLFLT